MTAVLALFLALQQPPAPASPKPATPAAPAPAAPAQPGAPAPSGAPAPQRRPATPASSTLTVRVTDRTGGPARDVAVTAEGPVSREGVSDASGQVLLRTLSNGTYRLRASSDNYITLEKEVTVRAGATTPTEMALSPAPPPPAPPPPPPAEPKPAPMVASDAKAGDSRVVSIADLAERSLNGRDPIKRVPVACSGLDTTEMIVLRETLNAPSNPNADVMIYVVAGEAMLSLGGRDQTITSGWYAMVPRGSAHVLTKRGRNPTILLSTTGGQPCAASGSR